jgi:general secretion pathway protein L
MAATGSLLSREVTLGSLKAAFLRFCAWERDECRAMLPPAALVWLMGRGAREALVKSGESDLILVAESGNPEIRVTGAEIAETSLDSALARRGLSRKSLAIILELPASSFLTRQFDAPVAALDRLPQMLNAEIERRTPFRRDEVLLGQHVAVNGAKGKAKVRIALLRHNLIAPALEPPYAQRPRPTDRRILRRSPLTPPKERTGDSSKPSWRCWRSRLSSPRWPSARHSGGK